MKYKTVLFDLDGTITDSSLGITSSVAYALDKKGIAYESKDSLKHFIGPPLKEQFMSCYGLSSEEGSEMVEFYREYYGTKGIYECSLYSGIIELLSKLKTEGAKVVLATSKPEKYARMILEHFSLTDKFDFIAGANLDNTRTGKADVIAYALESTGESGNKNAVVMVGDHFADVVGASVCGIDCIFVTYGFGDNSKGIEAGPVALADDVSDLEKYLFN